MNRALPILLLAVLVGTVASYVYLKQTPAGQPTEPSPPPAILGLPVELKVKQRTGEPIPGTAADLILSIDDITRDQVLTSLVTKDGTTILSSRLMQVGDVTEFRYRDQNFRLTLSAFDTAIIGEDYATFQIAAKSASLSESQKIEKLILSIEMLEGATFIRNDDEHEAAKAASHLRRKWDAAGDRVKTAEDFIDGLATKSSVSGEPYRIRFDDGSVALSGVFLHEQLRKIERGEN